MKNKLFLILILILTHSSFSQIIFEKGYYINNTNEKIDCLIKNIDWRNNPLEFDYKLNEQDTSKKITINSVKEFGIDHNSKYIRRTVNIDRSSEDLNKLSNNRNPIFSEEQLFLKVLVEGKNSLYEYIDHNLKRFFFNNKSHNVEQLVFKTYNIINGSYYRENNMFRQQLLNNLKCPDFSDHRFKKLKYKKRDLLNLFIEYNQCFNHKNTTFKKTQKEDLFNLNIRPRLVNSNLVVNTYSDLRDVDFGYNINVNLGVEAEFILPFNKNKWSIIIEPTYQSLKTEKTEKVSSSFGNKLTYKANYNSIEIPVGIRYYMFLKNKSKLFLNTSFVTDISFNSSIEYEREDELSDLTPLKIKSKSNLAFGFGYKYDDKYIAELRYQTKRGILEGYSSNTSYYNSLSLIIGYTLF